MIFCNNKLLKCWWSSVHILKVLLTKNHFVTLPVRVSSIRYLDIFGLCVNACQLILLQEIDLIPSYLYIALQQCSMRGRGGGMRHYDMYYVVEYLREVRLLMLFHYYSGYMYYIRTHHIHEKTVTYTSALTKSTKSISLKLKRDFFLFMYAASSAAPHFLLCRRMLGSNMGLLRLLHWQPYAQTTEPDLIRTRLDLIHSSAGSHPLSDWYHPPLARSHPLSATKISSTARLDLIHFRLYLICYSARSHPQLG